MAIKILALLLSLVIFTPAQLSFQDDEEAERTKYGMSQAEWQLFKESGLSVTQMEKFLECGISMTEYSSRPWLSLGVAEKDWVAERCKGLGDDDIQAFNESGDDDYSVLVAFALPGSYHWRNKIYPTAAALSSAFVISMTLYFLVPEVQDEPAQATIGNANYGERQEIKTKRPIFLVIALADMITSSILTYRHGHRAKITGEALLPPAKTSLHFDLNGNRPEIRCSYNF
jgi:hypothetical protein